MMLKRLVGSVTLLLLTSAVPAVAQVKGEVGIFAGWTFADGVSGNSFLAQDGNIYNRLDPKDSFGWGIDFGVLVGEGAEVGFIYGNQPSKLVAGGTRDTEIGDMSVNTYHGYFAYNFGGSDAKFRPYVMGGFGATSFGEVTYTRINPLVGTGTIGSVTKFSSTWGAGVKAYPGNHVGFRAGVRFTPAYIKSDAVGWWCDPYWGCYVVGDAQYANLFDLTGGVTFRF
jgi:opacity protein-like surface antigen